jgi:arylformamidase
VFRGYTRETLDREYDNARKVPESAAWSTRFERESARTRAGLPCRLDLAFGPSPAERLDVFLPPPAAGPAPVHVYFHGGYWRARDKRDFSFVARALAPAGAVVVVPNYALIPSVDMDELVRQCRAAVAWVAAHAKELGGDPGRITVSGHSAGGHLTAMMLATDWRPFGLPADLVRAGCGISGLYDLEPIRLCFLNDTLGLDPDAARRNSPVHLVPVHAADLLLVVGDREGPEYFRQSDDMAAAWRARGGACEVRRLSGHDHFSIVGELLEADSALARALRGQMGLV